MSKVVYLDCLTTLPIPPDRVLERAQGKLDEAVLIGIDKEGELYFAGSTSDMPDVLMLLERAKARVMEMYE